VTTGTAIALALPRPAETSLTAVLLLATAVWIGGLVAIFVAARVARATLGPAEWVAFFRGLGRAYGVALTAALASGAVLASTYRWDGQLTASAVVAAGLVALTVAGVAQARRMTRLRQDALRGPGSAELTAKVQRGARSRYPASRDRRAQPGAPRARGRDRNVTSSYPPRAGGTLVPDMSAWRGLMPGAMRASRYTGRARYSVVSGGSVTLAGSHPTQPDRRPGTQRRRALQGEGSLGRSHAARLAVNRS
jgi:hypothetical protein